jgi:hypothetical protein
MNYAVDAEHRDPSLVVREFLDHATLARVNANGSR